MLETNPSAAQSASAQSASAPARPFRSAWRAAAAMGLATLLAGCAALNSYPPAPQTVETQDHRYKIGPLDTLNIQVWRNPELSATVTEDMPAAGRNPADLARDMEKALAKYIRDPVVTILVGGFQGTYPEQIRIVGEATRPQAVPYRQQMTILDVMIQAGGLTDFADGNGAVLVRGSEGGKQYSVRLKDLLKRGDISANVAVKPGDIVIVPQSFF